MKIARQSATEVSVPTASMGDIAFLLTIFFILTTNFVRERNVQLKDPVSRDIKPLKEPQVFVSVDKTGNIWLQGQPISSDALENQVKSLVAAKSDKRVKLRVDKDLPQEKYGPVFLALSRAGVEISLVGMEKKGDFSE